VDILTYLKTFAFAMRGPCSAFAMPNPAVLSLCFALPSLCFASQSIAFAMPVKASPGQAFALLC
jgi:hypothetical protein